MNTQINPTIEQILTDKISSALQADELHGAHKLPEFGPRMRAAIAGIAATFVMNTRPPAVLIGDRTSKSYAADVLDFMVAMDQLPSPLSEFASTSDDTIKLASILMFGGGELGAFKKGECVEMKEAWAKFCKSRSLEHLTEFVDGGLDSIYVILWTLNKLGVPVDLCWQLVQRSNMAKLGPDGKAIKDPETGKVKKPEGWQPPDLFGVLAAHASQVTYVGGLARHD